MIDVDLPSAEPGSGRDGAGRSLAYHALLCLASLAMLYPLLWMLASSFKPENEIFGSASLWPSSVSIDAYWRGWTGLQVSFGRFFLNSLIISVLSVIGNVLSCSLAAYAVARLQFRGRGFWFALMLGTLMLPYHVTLIPQYVLFLGLGWIDTFLPLVVPKFLAVDAFFIFLLVQFFRGLPRELDEAAKIDGCSAFGIYWRIYLPLAGPALTALAVFVFMFQWNDLLTPLIYLSDPDKFTLTVGLAFFKDWGALFAMSTVTLLPVFALFVCFQRLLIQGIATTGLKG